MALFCVETDKEKLVKAFVRQSDDTLTHYPLFTNDSFIKLVEEKKKYLIIVNIVGFISFLSFPPKFLIYFIFRKGLRKAGYKGRIVQTNNNAVVIRLMKVFKNLSRRNT